MRHLNPGKIRIQRHKARDFRRDEREELEEIEMALHAPLAQWEESLFPITDQISDLKEEHKTHGRDREIYQRALRFCKLNLAHHYNEAYADKQARMEENINRAKTAMKNECWEAYGIYQKKADELSQPLTENERKEIIQGVITKMVWHLPKKLAKKLIPKQGLLEIALSDEWELLELKEKDLTLEIKELVRYPHPGMKQAKKSAKKLKKNTIRERHLLAKGKKAHKSKKTAGAKIARSPTVTHNSKKEKKKIAKRAMTKARNERTPTHLSIAERNKEMRKRIFNVKSGRGAKILEKRAQIKMRHQAGPALNYKKTR